jgi:hypothetical protein
VAVTTAGGLGGALLYGAFRPKRLPPTPEAARRRPQPEGSAPE